MVLTGNVWTVGETGEKTTPFLKVLDDSCGRGVTYANYLHLITGESVTEEASSTTRATGHWLYNI